MINMFCDVQMICAALCSRQWLMHVTCPSATCALSCMCKITWLSQKLWYSWTFQWSQEPFIIMSKIKLPNIFAFNKYKWILIIALHFVITLIFFPEYLENFLNIAFSSMIDFNASVICFSSSKLHLLKKQKHAEQEKKLCTQKEKYSQFRRCN